MTFSIIKISDDENNFFNYLKGGRIGINYFDTKSLILNSHNHSVKAGMIDLSFHIFEKSNHLATVCLYTSNGKLFNCTGSETPVQIIINSNEERLMTKIYSLAYDEIFRIIKDYSISELNIFEDDYAILYKKIYRDNTFICENYRLTLNELTNPQNFKSELRKSYHSNINWAASNINISIFGPNDLNPEFKNIVQQILLKLLENTFLQNGNHFSNIVFNAHMESIVDFGGEVSIATYGSSIVGLIVVIDFDDYSYYALGGSVKNIGESKNKNIHPYLLLKATERAKERGSSVIIYDRFFNSAKFQFNRGGYFQVGEHEANLHFFKMGMSNKSFSCNSVRVFFD
jgi:hypothetical protein